MLPSDLERDLRREIRTLLARLELMPHGATANYEGSSGPHGFGPTPGRLPGGIDRRDDRQAPSNHHPQRSHEHFRRRYANATTVRALEAIRDDLQEALRAWQRTPPSSGGDPEFGTFAWKRWVANSDVSTAEMARRFNVSRQYIHKLRHDLRDAA